MAVIKKEGYFLNRLPTIINTYQSDRKLIDWKKVEIKFKKCRKYCETLKGVILKTDKLEN